MPSLWRLFTSTANALPLERPARAKILFMPNIISSWHSFLPCFCPTLCSSVLARFLPTWPLPAPLLLRKAPVSKWVCLLVGDCALCAGERLAWVSRCLDGQLEKGEEARAVKHPAARCGASHPWLWEGFLHNRHFIHSHPTWWWPGSPGQSLKKCLSCPVDATHPSDF